VMGLTCLSAACQPQDPTPVRQPASSEQEEQTHVADDLAHSVLTEALTESELLRFLDVLPAFAHAVEQARLADDHPDRWQVHPLSSPADNRPLWRRLGPMVGERFGPGFGRTWVKVWSAFAAVQARRRLRQAVAAQRPPKASSHTSASQGADLHGAPPRVTGQDLVNLPLIPGPPKNVELIRPYVDQMSDISRRLFEPPREP